MYLNNINVLEISFLYHLGYENKLNLVGRHCRFIKGAKGFLYNLYIKN